MSILPLSHFPDLCLLAIFKHIPLIEVIHTIGLVCPNWARVQRDELKRRTKHLVIVQDYCQCQLIQQQENPYGSDLIEYVRDDDGLPWAQLPQLDEFNTLRVPGDVLTESFTSSLIALLPNITHLTIFQINISPIDSVVDSLEQIVLLLNQYSTKLVSLKLHFTSNIPIQTHIYNHEWIVRELFNSINRLNSLQHLSLNVKFPDFQAKPRLSILSRLTTFNYHNFQPSSLLLESLRQYATAGDVRIGCDWGLGIIHMREIARLDPQLASRFTRTSSSFHETDNPQLLCTRFTSLTTLELKVFMPMNKLSQALSLLPHLISLNLKFNQILEDERPPQIEIAQVPSVRLLILTIYTFSHHETELLHLHRIFPNLQVLHLIHGSYRCDECQYEMSNIGESEMASRIGHCMCLARQPFRACANLHTLKLDINRICPSQPEELFSVDQWHDLDSRILAEYKHSSVNPNSPNTSTTFSTNFDKISSFILSLFQK